MERQTVILSLTLSHKEKHLAEIFNWTFVRGSRRKEHQIQCLKDYTAQQKMS